ncbi:kinetochore Sim4 complex subunit Fta4 [Lipomyces starkeyi]
MSVRILTPRRTYVKNSPLVIKSTRPHDHHEYTGNSNSNMNTAASVYDAKRAFVDSQARIFAVPLRPSVRWLRQHPNAAQSPAALERVLRQRELSGSNIGGSDANKLLLAVHTLQRRHVRQVYSSQALQHVALQIDGLHRNRKTTAVAPLVVVAAVSEQQAVLRGETELSEPESIEALPEFWPESSAEDSALTEKYSVLRDQLFALSSALVSARRRRDHATELHSLVSLFRDPVQTVQPNLVARDGTIEQELTRMRVLLARLASRLPPKQQQCE